MTFPSSVDWRVGTWTSREHVEWLLDGFARALLLPATQVKQRWRELRTTHATRDAAVLIAGEYRVDMATLATRLSDLATVDEAEAADIRATTRLNDALVFDSGPLSHFAEAGWLKILHAVAASGTCSYPR